MFGLHVNQRPFTSSAMNTDNQRQIGNPANDSFHDHTFVRVFIIQRLRGIDCFKGGRNWEQDDEDVTWRM